MGEGQKIQVKSTLAKVGGKQRGRKDRNLGCNSIPRLPLIFLLRSQAMGLEDQVLWVLISLTTHRRRLFLTNLSASGRRFLCPKQHTKLGIFEQLSKNRYADREDAWTPLLVWDLEK